MEIEMIGGWDYSNSNYMKTNLEYDIQNDKFKKSNISMKNERYDHQIIEINQRNVLIFGGYGNEGYLKSIELYDKKERRFTEIGEMKVGRRRFGVGKIQNKIIIFDGYDKEYEIVKKIERIEYYIE
jgi:hypothetical protein